MLRDVTARTAIRLEKCYLKHGTSIAVRLLVIDKVPGKSPPATIQRASVTELTEALVIPDRAHLRAEEWTFAPKRSKNVYRSARSEAICPRRGAMPSQPSFPPQPPWATRNESASLPLRA